MRQCRSGRFFLRQADAKVACLVDGFTVGFQPAVGGAQHEPAAHDSLEVDAVLEELRMRADHSLELHFTGGECHSAALFAEPAPEEAGQLPHAVEAEAEI